MGIRKKSLPVLFAIVLTVLPNSVHSFVTGPVAREVLEEVLKKAASSSGKDVLTGKAKDTALRNLDEMVKKYGDEALKVVKDGGIELIEGVPRHGEEIFELAVKASPAARKAFARELDSLLPIARRNGIDVLELEAKAPGTAIQVFRTFGDEGGMTIAKKVPRKDVPRLLTYGKKADSDATRKLLLEMYEEEREKLFERIPAKLVLAAGLTATMLYGTHRLTEPSDAVGDQIRSSEGTTIATSAVKWSIVAVAIVATIVLLPIPFLILRRKSRN